MKMKVYRFANFADEEKKKDATFWDAYCVTDESASQILKSKKIILELLDIHT